MGIAINTENSIADYSLHYWDYSLHYWDIKEVCIDFTQSSFGKVENSMDREREQRTGCCNQRRESSEGSYFLLQRIGDQMDFYYRPLDWRLVGSNQVLVLRWGCTHQVKGY